MKLSPSQLLALLIFLVMSTTQSSGAKTVYLIRHAESEENRRIGSLKTSLRDIGSFKLPSKKDVYAVGELLNVPAQIDSNVSEKGKDQIDFMRKQLDEEDFLVEKQIKLVVHSPLIRARETSEGMLGCASPNQKPDSVDRVVELDLLKEMTPQEWMPIYRNNFKRRVSEFEKWLSEQPEDNIALVGHSEYFKAMLGLDFKFGNCDVWQIIFDRNTCSSTIGETKQETVIFPCLNEKKLDDSSVSQWHLPPQWSDLKKLYTGKKDE